MRFPTRYNKYGYGWLDKIDQGFHPGIDYNYGEPYEDAGQEVIAITDGIVKYAKSNKGWGWHVLIYHPKYDVYSHYAHLQSFCIQENEEVKEGQLIGFLGGTGGNWFPHLHFEIRLKDFPPNKYVIGMTEEEIKVRYANPETWIKEKIQQEQKIIENNIKDNQQNNFMKLIKNTSSKKVYAIGADNKKHWIFNEETFNIGKEMGLWGKQDEIEIQNDDGFEEGHTIIFINKS
jgi:murein DD-endopeptidase MepM/ murein hydrolase activator NlpD